MIFRQMEFLRSVGRKIFGFDQEKKVEVFQIESNNRKRPLEEVITKDILNQPAKKPRMESPDSRPGLRPQSFQSAISSEQFGY